MLEKEKNVHDGCPYRGHCKKDEKQCCYLVTTGCYLDNEQVEYFV